jgi:hypothetical protein
MSVLTQILELGLSSGATVANQAGLSQASYLLDGIEAYVGAVDAAGGSGSYVIGAGALIGAGVGVTAGVLLAPEVAALAAGIGAEAAAA